MKGTSHHTQRHKDKKQVHVIADQGVPSQTHDMLWPANPGTRVIGVMMVMAMILRVMRRVTGGGG